MHTPFWNIFEIAQTQGVPRAYTRNENMCAEVKCTRISYFFNKYPMLLMADRVGLRKFGKIFEFNLFVF